MTPRVESPGDGKGLLLCAGENTGIARRGEESSAPLSWSTEKPPSLGGSRAADGRAAALSCQGCIISLAVLGADTHGGEEPLPRLAPSSLCPDFFAAATKDHRQLELQPQWYSCGLSGAVPPL